MAERRCEGERWAYRCTMGRLFRPPQFLNREQVDSLPSAMDKVDFLIEGEDAWEERVRCPQSRRQAQSVAPCHYPTRPP